MGMGYTVWSSPLYLHLDRAHHYFNAHLSEATSNATERLRTTLNKTFDDVAPNQHYPSATTNHISILSFKIHKLTHHMRLLPLLQMQIL